jgi:hypothetical protein
MNIQNLVAVWKQLQTTIIVVIVLIILFGFYSSFKAKQTSQLQNQLAKQELVIQQLKKALETPAKGQIYYVTKPLVKVVTKYVPYYITQATMPPTAVTIAKDDLCRIADQNKIAIKVAIQNDAIYCQTDFCDPADSVIKLKAQAFTAITNIEQHKQGILHISGIAGYEVVHSNFVIGASFLDWHNIIAGLNAGFNFKRLSDTNAGVFIGYRPQLWGKDLNVSVGAGPIYGLHGWGGQALILFHWWN